jgi:hypothetical protein
MNRSRLKKRERHGDFGVGVMVDRTGPRWRWITDTSWPWISHYQHRSASLPRFHWRPMCMTAEPRSGPM